jgi:hypothetical protein
MISPGQGDPAAAVPAILDHHHRVVGADVARGLRIARLDVPTRLPSNAFVQAVDKPWDLGLPILNRSVRLDAVKMVKHYLASLK